MEFETQLNELLDGVKSISEKESIHADEVKQIKEQAESFEKSFSELQEKNTEAEAKVAELNDQVKSLEDSIETISAKANRPQLFGKESEMTQTFTVKETNEFVKNEMLAKKHFEYSGAEGEVQVKGMNVTTANGGERGEIAIVEEMERAILKRLLDDYAILNVLGTRTLSSPDFKRLVDKTRSATRWVGENSSATAVNFTDSPTLQFITPVLGKIQAYSFITDEAMEDPAVDLKSYMVNDIADQMGRAVSEAMWRGDGSNKPKGILNFFEAAEISKDDETRKVTSFAALETSTSGKLAAGTGAALSQAIIDQLLTLIYDLKTGYRSNARFIMNRKTFAELAKLKNTQGDYYLTKDIAKGSDGTLLGFPITIDDYADDIAAGKFPILFGDFTRGFEFVNYRGMKSLTDNITAPGATKVYFDRRVGSMIGDNKAIRGLKVKA